MKNLFTIFMCLFGAIASGQTTESLELATKKLYAAFNEVDIEYLSNAIWTSNEKQSVYDELDAYFLNEVFKFRFVYTDAKIAYSPVKILDGKCYAGVKFRNVVRITYFSPLENPADMAQELKTKFNAQSVVYEKVRNSLHIVYTANLIAVAETGSLQWKFAFTDETLPRRISETCLKNANINKELGIN